MENTEASSSSSSSDRVDSRGPLRQPRVATTTSLGPLRHRKTKIGTEVAHVTRDSDTTFRVKRSKVKVTRLVYSPRRLRTGSCSGQRGNVLSVGNCCYVAVCRRGGRLGGARRYVAHTGRRRRAGHIVSPRAQLVIAHVVDKATPNSVTPGVWGGRSTPSPWKPWHLVHGLTCHV